MMQRLLAAMLAGSLLTEEVAVAGGEDDDSYAHRGAIEASGGLSTAWTRDLFTITLGPRIGYFLADRFELSALLDLSYAQARGERFTLAGTLAAEPSYHVPLSAKEQIFLFTGLGVGAGFDGRKGAFELIPRAGANLVFGRAGVLTPSVRVPILFRAEAPVLAGIEGDLSIGTVF